MLADRIKLSSEEEFLVELHLRESELEYIDDGQGYNFSAISSDDKMEYEFQTRVALLHLATVSTKMFVDGMFATATDAWAHIAGTRKDLKKHLKAPILEAHFQTAADELRRMRDEHPPQDHRLYNAAILLGAKHYTAITGHEPRVP